MSQAHDQRHEQASPASSSPGTRSVLPGGMSLRAKGIVAMMFFLGYTLAAGFIMGVERNTLYSDVQQLEAVHAEEGAQFGLNMLVTRAILVVNDNYFSANLRTATGQETAARSIAVQIEAVLTGLGRVVESHPDLLDSIIALQINLADLTDQTRPLNQELIAEARNSLHKLVLSGPGHQTDTGPQAGPARAIPCGV